MDLSEVFNESETSTAIDYTWEVPVFITYGSLKRQNLSRILVIELMVSHALECSKVKSERMNVVNCVRINWLVFYLFSCLSASLSERWKMRRPKHLSVSTRLLRPVVSYLYVLITIKNCSNLRQIRIIYPFLCFVSLFCFFLFIFFYV